MDRLEEIKDLGSFFKKVLDNNPTMTIEDLSKIVKKISEIYDEGNIQILCDYFDNVYRSKGWNLLV